MELTIQTFAMFDLRTDKKKKMVRQKDSYSHDITIAVKTLGSVCFKKQ